MPDSIDIKLAGLATEHNAAVDSLLAAFNAELKKIVAHASTRTLAILQARLDVDEHAPHVVASTPANAAVLRDVGDVFDAQMKEAGYDALVDSYTDRFSSQFRWFDELLAIVAPGESAAFTHADKAWFVSQQLASADSLKAVVDIVGALAQQRVLFGVGGMPIADLAEALAERFDTTLAAAARIADTAIVMYSRSIAERGFADIERGLPEGAARYKYYGPLDRVTREYCIAMLARTERTPLTRAQIAEYPNGQIPGDPFISCGGFFCRHAYYIVSLATSATPASSAA